MWVSLFCYLHLLSCVGFIFCWLLSSEDNAFVVIIMHHTDLFRYMHLLASWGGGGVFQKSPMSATLEKTTVNRVISELPFQT